MASPDSPDKKKNFWRRSLTKKGGNRYRAASLNNDNNSNPESFRVVFVGPQCGKSCLVRRILDNKFVETEEPTIGFLISIFICFLNFFF